MSFPSISQMGEDVPIASLDTSDPSFSHCSIRGLEMNTRPVKPPGSGGQEPFQLCRGVLSRQRQSQIESTPSSAPMGACYPLDDQRATLVSGRVSNDSAHTVAIDGTRPGCSGAMLRNIQIDGKLKIVEVQFLRLGDLTLFILPAQLVLPSRHGRASPLHQLCCKGSVVRNNMVMNPTDREPSSFFARTQVYNNTIWVTNQTLLGGINLVDYLPWGGDYRNTIVRDNTIVGGRRTSRTGMHKRNNACIGRIPPPL
ncbi:hypothetical protein B0H13DRAFT_2352871 [Mycena leptocephala]|nr:hypothetical protein B0H13DRAFT_2352871 [Mycena leptocephala]